MFGANVLNRFRNGLTAAVEELSEMVMTCTHHHCFKTQLGML